MGNLIGIPREFVKFSADFLLMYAGPNVSSTQDGKYTDQPELSELLVVPDHLSSAEVLQNWII